jgi:hypothetical protein
MVAEPRPIGHLTQHQAGPLWQPNGCDVGLIRSAVGPNAPNRSSSPEISPRAPNGENARFVIIAFVATVTVALAILIVTLPRQVVLPAFSICALAAAACVALVASFRTGVRRLSAWNLAGAFTLVGCAAAILGEIEAIVEYTRMTAPRSRADD